MGLVLMRDVSGEPWWWSEDRAAAAAVPWQTKHRALVRRSDRRDRQRWEARHALGEVPSWPGKDAQPGDRYLGRWIQDRVEQGGDGGEPADWDRAMAWRDARSKARESSCSVWRILLRHRESGARLVAPMACGVRSCEVCGEDARLHARSRVIAGPAGTTQQARAVTWTVMLTLTCPRSYWSSGPEAQERDPAVVARNLGRWTGRFLKQLLRKWNERKGLYRDWRNLQTQYAWVIEAHPEDPRWTHVHVAMSLDNPWMKRGEFLRFRRWMAYTWDEVTGAVNAKYARKRRGKVGTWGVFKPRQGPGRSRVHWQPSTKTGRWSGGYLVKYLSKGHYNRFLLAAMYRKRLVGSTLKRAAKAESPWQVVGRTDREADASMYLRGLLSGAPQHREDELRRAESREDQAAADWLFEEVRSLFGPSPPASDEGAGRNAKSDMTGGVRIDAPAHTASVTDSRETVPIAYVHLDKTVLRVEDGPPPCEHIVFV